MDPRTLKDPAAAVPRELLPHLHLVSKHRYPILANPSLDTLVSYLEQAPKIMREAPVQWQYLDTPGDGTLFLTWQPIDYLNTSFASDGYVWADVEQPFNSEVRGYTLQMFYHRTGYKPQAENVATHSRRRYRLVATTQMGMNNPDPSLWLIHYSKAAPENRHPVASLPVLPHTAQIFNARQVIQRGGQLPRKEFLLHDRTQWPVISLPTGIGKPGAVVAGHRRAGSMDQQALIEEEEDVSRGDVLDFITPREISRMRYEQHHEWMEEILESHYATKQIIPSELGLGKKGTLEVFTNGFFTAPMSHAQDPLTGPIGKLGSVKADEFTKHADSKLAEMQADLEKMKQQHIRRMEKLKRTTDLGMAERKIRSMNPADDSYKTVAAHVQNMMGRKIDVVHKVHQVSKGGQQDIKPIIQQPQYNAHQNAYAAQAQQQQQLMQMQAQNTQQQQRTQPQPSQQTQQSIQQSQQSQAQAQPQTTAPSAQPSEQQQEQQTTSQPQQSSSSSQQQAQQQPSHTQAQAQASTAEPTEESVAVPSEQPMETTDSQPTPDSTNEQVRNNDALETGDLDMNEYGDGNNGGGDIDTGNADGDDWDMLVDQSGGVDDQNVDDQNGLGPETSQDVMQNTASPSQEGQNNNNMAGDANDFDMVADFDANMDTAGDALADYGVDDDLNLDDSAFGDAFHHNEHDLA